MVAAATARALRQELQRRILEELRDYERVTGETVSDLEAETFQHPQVPRKVIGVRVTVAGPRSTS